MFLRHETEGVRYVFDFDFKIAWRLSSIETPAFVFICLIKGCVSNVVQVT